MALFFPSLNLFLHLHDVLVYIYIYMLMMGVCVTGTYIPFGTSRARARNINFMLMFRALRCRGIASLRHYASVHGSNAATKVVLPKFSTVTHLSTILKTPIVKVQDVMENLGFTSTHYDYIVDDESAVMIADELGIEGEVNKNHGEDLYPQTLPESLADFPLRPPVIALMGHVDHGKTTLLDYFRKSHIVKGEKGGITQHIGAFLTQVGDAKKNPSISDKICFLDTPGHEAFLKLRKRGAHLTDVILLVVAADDSVMPQTKEAIKHASAAGVPMIVALTKCDKPEAKPERVVADLSAAGVDVEEYGGSTQCIPVSAVTGKGVDELIAAVQAEVEVLDLRSPAKAPYKAEGVVVESSVVKGIGPAASVIVRKGTLKPRQVVVAGHTWCRVRQLSNEFGKMIKEAPPGTPVRITGWKELPEPGDTVLEAKDENTAKRVIANRKRLMDEALEAKQIAVINENKVQQAHDAEARAEHEERAALGLSSSKSGNANPNPDHNGPVAGEQAQEGPEDFPFLIKADVAGSAEAVSDIIRHLGNEEVKASVLLSGVGAVTESDVFRAETANASIISFSLPVGKPIERLAEQRGVSIKRYDVIYKAMEDISAFLSSKLEPVVTRKVVSTSDIRALFTITLKKKQKLIVAGIKVGRGTLTTNQLVQVKRDDKIVHEGKLGTIQHGKDHVSEAHKGSEYGVTFEKWTEFQEGDVIEGYEEIKTPRYI